MNREKVIAEYQRNVSDWHNNHLQMIDYYLTQDEEDIIRQIGKAGM